MSDAASIQEFHDAALDSLHGLVRFHDLVLRYNQLSCEQRSSCRIEVMYQDYMIPLFQGLKKLGTLKKVFFELMTTARLSLGRDIVKFADMPAANAHELAFAVPIFFIRLWNRLAQPKKVEIPPSLDGPWKMVLYAPAEEMDLNLYLEHAHQRFQNFNPLHQHVESKLEYAKANAILQESLVVTDCRFQLEGEMWHLRYLGECGRFPAKGNKSISMIAKLVASPNRQLTVAELRGDPGGRLTCDASLGSELEVDRKGLITIKERLQEIDDITEEVGGSERIENERADLLHRLKSAKDYKRLASKLSKDHHNIASQIRGLVRKKLVKNMPNLAAHLTATLKLDFPHFGYFPPTGTPDWNT